MEKIIIQSGGYSFDALEKKVVISDSKIAFNIEGLLLITNTTDNIIIYNFGCVGFGGIIFGNSIVLEYDTTSMSDTDSLQIIVYKSVERTDNEYLREISKSNKNLEEIVGALNELVELTKQQF